MAVARARRVAVMGAVGVLVVAGVVSLAWDELQAGDGPVWSDPLVSAADLAVGVAYGALAVLAARRSRALAALVAGIAGAWWLGTWWLPAAFWHRGVLVHLLLTFPAPWASRAGVRAAVVVGYVASVGTSIWADERAAAVLVLALVGCLVLLRRAAPRHAVRARTAALVTGALVAAAVLGDALARSVVPLSQAVRPSFVVYCVALVVAAGTLALALRRPDPSRVGDLVVELGEHGSDDVLAELARLTGDPDLRRRLGRDPDQAQDAADPEVRDAIRNWTALTRANADLRERTQASIADVAASRRRLLLAADAERTRLAAHLGSAVAEPLHRLHARLADASGPADVTRRLVDVLAQVDRAADGLDPPGLDLGLDAALALLAARAPLPLTLDVAPVRADPNVERAAYYVCAEAMTNAAKHSGAARVDVRVRLDDGVLVVTVRDDGRGGAAPAPGSGLAGLDDRVAALGGSLTVDSAPGAGTTIRAMLPG
ncbi:putative signal transduction histidine kinase [Xylanimonas cellulosilytica DSM 15894]|uniref:histidine kinase n=1 Tax=Xylanimonas cellulosilytica (strain DSM 15894 / JCM 12276 / CECT 5975 / KCTC 9989 / LMG 20990 / NBRC 107835 / XIL07) TaxID=446471 RepID=D1BS03_XYLCX|nr:sensor histidine kinase [Xylanimonas cellulosilytica]ACZ30495.1 putative signal transduction histidine kinase [Xylanimonas cellulosilytica DSM 15894]